MTKKKRHHPDVEEVLSRPWCYYCERDFDDLKILINHQKAKHFKCERCGRRLNTAGGLSVHMSQVHKENLTAVDNALPNRVGLDIEIFGMEGIPEDIVQQHNQRVLTNFHQAQAERQAATGNNAQNGPVPSAPKKPKVEQISDIKARLAAHKAAKLAAENGEGGSSGGNTPKTPAAAQLSQPQANPVGHLKSLFDHIHSYNLQAATPAYPGYQQPYTVPPTNGSYSQPPSFPQPPAPASTAYQPPPTYPTIASPPAVGAYGQTPIPQSGQPGYPQPYGQQPYAPPPTAPFQQQSSPVGYPPQPSFSPPQYIPQYPGQSFLGQPNALPRPPYPGSPAPGFPQPPPPLVQQSLSPATNGNFPAPVRTGSVSLPSAPGLPQRPAFGAPPVNAFQFQQMHQGQLPASQSHNVVSQYASGQAASSTAAGPPPQLPAAAEAASSLDDLIANASKQADANAAAAAAAASAKTATPTAPAPAATELVEDKAGPKKDKEKEKPKSTRLVYSDNETSPEERMAKLAKYAFTPAQNTVVV
ncbi:hypothetical protein A1O7_08052 [Cladophialophora yegresii CBS 114405]|uniref:C2H2-type domain-containing protein n=1 Tax=Cladophialophora yegresii CBS 114405 TaxID=1182544 RepID=W9VHK1_9EURO|nr:uncharacterized protein A1O7_08052 [Cladophialophora yegresii CBS 114405]EXJ55127.1 hypothetical protein A1O7_08052 [Cladophialophora yegresii CBS 114405]